MPLSVPIGALAALSDFLCTITVATADFYPNLSCALWDTRVQPVLFGW
jgi:hypothetical protein